MLILSGHRGKVHTLAFAPDGQTLASAAGHDTRIWLWDLAAGRPSAHAQHHRRIVALAFAPGERPVLVCANNIGHITRWDIPSGKERYFDQVVPVAGRAVRLAFSPDGRLLGATGAYQPGQLPWRSW